jgi:hypothetical protein
LWCRLREYFHQRKHVRIAERAFLVTRKLSTRLQVEVITLVYGAWLSKLTFLIGCEMPCVMAIAMRFQPVTYAPSESPPLRHLYVVMRGLATYGLQYMRRASNAHPLAAPCSLPPAILTIASMITLTCQDDHQG